VLLFSGFFSYLQSLSAFLRIESGFLMFSHIFSCIFVFSHIFGYLQSKSMIGYAFSEAYLMLERQVFDANSR